MLRLLQKLAPSLGAAMKTALPKTQPPKRATSQKVLDLGLNEKPSGTSFAMIWFRQGKTSAKPSDSLGTPGRGQGKLVAVQLCCWRGASQGLTAPSEDLNQPQNDKARRAVASFAMENWSERRMLSILPPGNPPAPWQGGQAGISFTTDRPHQYPYLFAAET